MKSRKKILHVLAWILLACHFFYENTNALKTQSWEEFLLFRFIQIMHLLLIFYLNYSIFTPQLLIKRRKIILYVCSVFGLFFISQLYTEIVNFFLVHFSGIVDHRYKLLARYDLNHTSFIAESFYILIYLLISMGVRLGEQYYSDKIKSQELRLSLKKSELSKIKNQVDPDFLNAGLNIIYKLAKNNSSETSETILLFAGVMRYITYEGVKKEVSIYKELAFLEDYLELQKIGRQLAQNKVRCQITLPKKDFVIFPLLLASLTEKAFDGINIADAKYPITISFGPSDIGFCYEVSYKKSEQKNVRYNLTVDKMKKVIDLIDTDRYELKTFENNQIEHISLKLKLNV